MAAYSLGFCVFHPLQHTRRALRLYLSSGGSLFPSFSKGVVLLVVVCGASHANVAVYCWHWIESPGIIHSALGHNPGKAELMFIHVGVNRSSRDVSVGPSFVEKKKEKEEEAMRAMHLSLSQ